MTEGPYQEDKVTNVSPGASHTDTTLTPAFKLAFLTVLALTVLAFLLNGVLAVLIDNPNDQVKSFLGTCSSITQGGVGAIIGMVAGKSV